MAERPALPPEIGARHAHHDGYKPDPETIRVMGVAFEMVRVALRLNDRNDLPVEIIANRIIELAKEGERNPDLLCERALRDLCAPPPE